MLSLKQITKDYKVGDDTVRALKGIDINFRQHEFVSILGPSGCGKTTALNIIGGLDKYTSGDLVIDNISTKHYKDRDWDTYRNHKIGFVFQNYNLIPHLSVLKNVEIALSMSNTRPKERKKRAIKVLCQVGLKDQIYKKPNQLSGGQMQRVAIARALANNPEIILADEPTGALDTKTSIQIMKILKKISKKKLIIMVTHNTELAEEYSTRIIKLLDGKKVGDTNPYKEKEIKKDEKSEKKKLVGKKTSMSFFTALSLSLKNLLTKKGRTFLTSFAGSIGIIGVALVLAISNGFTNYINSLQSDTLSNYPVSISTAVVDYSSLSGIGNDIRNNNSESKDYIVVYDTIIQKYIGYGHYNYLGEELMNKIASYMQTNEQNNNINFVEYNYYVPLKFLIKDETENVKITKNTNTISILSGGGNGLFYRQIDNEEYMLSQYEVIYQTDDYNKNDKYGLTLVVDNGNQLSSSILSALNIKLSKDLSGNYLPLDYEKVCEQELKLVFNNDYYIFNGTGYDNIDNKSQEELANIYNSLTKTLKINRIIRQKENAGAGIITNGIMYSKALEDEYLNDCKTSDIALSQQQLKQEEYTSQQGQENINYTFLAPYKINIAEFPTLFNNGFGSTNFINGFLQSYFNCSPTPDEAYELGMQEIGVSSLPQSIVFYPNNFDGKTQVIELLNEYNKTASESHQIIYTDTSSALLSMLSNLINIIGYVLIAFASISLVVSSIMIGIITYVSVIERTKEIGVLRSLGARKKDISRVFNAETIIIGFMAGVIGVVISYLLGIVISIIVNNLAGIANIALLNPIHALALIGISILLTLISGSIPSRIAANRDPVICLRTE